MNQKTLLIICLLFLGGAVVYSFSRSGGSKIVPQYGQSTITTPQVSGSYTPTAQTEGAKAKGEVAGMTLTISSPAAGQVVTSSAISVKGKTTPRAEVFVNDAETKADSSGNFSARVNLDEGDNYILVTVNDAEGNSAEKELTVTYTPAE